MLVFSIKLTLYIWKNIMKTLISGALLILMLNPLWAANPFWQEGKTDTQYDITVYRSATCGCCKGWVSHLRDHNFNVNDVEVTDLNKYKEQYNIPRQAASCHTAVVDGIAIEGHVPAQDIKRLLQDKGRIRLLTVPAMPSGTPGMDTPDSPKHAFRVFSINQDDEVGIFNEYRDY